MNTTQQGRRAFLAAPLALALPAWIGTAQAANDAPLVEVWKSPTCGCCKDWIAHLQADGFQVRSYDSGNTDARARLKMPLAYGSCHTALVGGYVIEGHVPAREIRRLLKDKPTGVIGLAAPGMPVGSPGMDGPAYGGRRDPYDVLMVRADGQSSVYQSYR